jgi:hypothetical protein
MYVFGYLKAKRAVNTQGTHIDRYTCHPLIRIQCLSATTSLCVPNYHSIDMEARLGQVVKLTHRIFEEKMVDASLQTSLNGYT